MSGKKLLLKKKDILSSFATDKHLLFLIQKRYFTEKLNDNFLRCFHSIFKETKNPSTLYCASHNKKKTLFKKQLTKIISNSYYSNYNNYILYLVENPCSCNKLIFIKQVSLTMLLPDIKKVEYKKLFKKLKNQNNKIVKKPLLENFKDSNKYIFDKKIFLNTNIIKIKNKSVFYSFTPVVNPLLIMAELGLKNNYSTKQLKRLFNAATLPKKLFIPEQKFSSLFKTVSSLNYSSNESNMVTSLPFNTNPLPISFQSQIDCYYPIFSKFILKNIDSNNDNDEDKPEFKEFWSTFQAYMTPTFSKKKEKDVILYPYFNRLENRYITVNNCTYKYKKKLLTGNEAISYWLKTLNLVVLENQFKNKLRDIDEIIKLFNDVSLLYEFQEKTLKKIIKIRHKVVRFMKLIYYLKKNKLRPEWLMISILPVLPPDLRPIIQLDANQMAVSDLNQLYKRVLYRNNRVEKCLKKDKTKDSNVIRFHQRLLQESVDALLDNGKGGSQIACSPNGRPFKSLSEILKGKKGRFRQNLLGKRVDYSGRSVIIVGPTLKLHQCGLPKEMALELFQTFILRNLRNLPNTEKVDQKITMVQAKKLIKSQHPIIWEVLKKLLKTHPILLNRAPTLHRLGIQAFQPILVENRAILLHPLVCPAFNADFDGDQMAVHVPLSFQARAEAWNLMWSRNNLLSPATGEPILIPSQDMVLGCYYLTTRNLMAEKRILNSVWYNNATQLQSNCSSFLSYQSCEKIKGKSSLELIAYHNFNKYTYFTNLKHVLLAYNQKQIALHSFIWVKWENIIEIENFYEKPIEIRIDYYGNVIKIYSKYFQNLNTKNKNISQFMLTTVGRIVLNTVILENIVF